MYKSHPNFEPPPPDQQLWRYMDFTKFMALIEKQSLFFCRADLLSDPWEGSLSRPTAGLMRSLLTVDPSKWSDDYDPIAETHRTWRKAMYISCWHLNQYESAAMWKLYLKSDEGIAVRTTFERLRGCFDPKDEQCQVHVGRVRYLDYETGIIPAGNIFPAFLSKRVSFAHEQEVRAIISKFPPCEEPGLSVHVDLSSLIEEILVAPTAPDWIRKLIASIAERYCLTARVVRSRLSEDPIY